MNRRIRRALARGKRKISKRLDELLGATKPRVDGGPEFTTARPVYEVAERTQAVGCGGIGVIHQMVNALGLPTVIDTKLKLIKQPRPYHDSDHVLNIAYNLLCEGQVLNDIEVRRNDAAFLDLLGARAIPDSHRCWRLLPSFRRRSVLATDGCGQHPRRRLAATDAVLHGGNCADAAGRAYALGGPVTTAVEVYLDGVGVWR